MKFSPILLASSPGGRSTRARTFNESLEDHGVSVRYRTFAIGGVVGDTLFLFLENLFAAPHQLFRLGRSLPAEKLQRLGFQLVGGHEEFFQLFLDLGRQVLNALQLRSWCESLGTAMTRSLRMRLRLVF